MNKPAIPPQHSQPEAPLAALVQPRRTQKTRLAPLPLATLLLLALAGQTSHASPSQAEAGRALLVVGQAQLQQGNSAPRPLASGAILQAGDKIITGAGTHVHVRMADGGLVAVRPDTILEIEVFQYQPGQAAQGKVRYRLEKGVARSVTGKVGQANKEAFRFNTPVAAIGVRGTDFTAATTAEHTRVAVNQGIVVVASLGGACQAEAFGVCAGNALQLVAGKDIGYAEVGLHAPVPQLRQDTNGNPSRQAPAHPAEPLALLEEQRTAEIAQAAATLTPAATPEAPSPPRGSNDKQPGKIEVEGPSQPPVHWGRWSGQASTPGDPRVAELLAAGKKIHLVNSHYGVGVSKLPDVLPSSGAISFNVGAASALLQTRSGAIEAAQVDHGRLDVNFGANTFQVSAQVSALGQAHGLQAAGNIDPRGYLMSDPARSNATINTVLNANLQQAGSVFTKPIDAGTLSGAIHWQR